MKKTIYTAPEVMAYEVAAERGYQASAMSALFVLDNFGAETDGTEW